MLRIEISEGPDDGSSVTIQGVNMPPPPEDIEAFEEWDKCWTGICNGIHALLAHLGPFPEAGWNVQFWLECAEETPS